MLLRPYRTILPDALNGQTASGIRTWIRLVVMRCIISRMGRWGVGSRNYTCALFIIDGLGHTTWSSTMPVSRSRTVSF